MPDQPDSLAFPWPHAHELRGPAVRCVIDDPVWMAAVRRGVNFWQSTQPSKLPLARFAELRDLDSAANDQQLLDIVEVTNGQLSTAAEWIDLRRKKNPVAALLCRRTLVEPDHRAAATQLLREAGAVEVLATPPEVPRLAAVFSWLTARSNAAANSLGELPLPCWAPPWQAAR